MIFHDDLCWRMGWLLSAVITGSGVVTAHTTRPEPPGAAEGISLPALQRVVRHFDFEEAERAPYEMPLGFYQIISAEPGPKHMPNPPGFFGFGTMQLRNDAATSGRWSFRFDLNGGSMAARIPTGVIQVLPGSDYRISINARTRGLLHARVRLAAWFHDAGGKPIPASRVESNPRRTQGEWEMIDLEISGDFSEAADLVVELQLVQPRHFDPRMGEINRPMGEDIHGTAWFDDLVIRNIPRIELNTTTPGNLFLAPNRPALDIRVQDIAKEVLAMRLRIFDLDGSIVHEINAPAPRERKAREFALPLDRYGWYAAVLDITSADSFSERRTLRFAWLPPAATADRNTPGGVPPGMEPSMLNPRFGVVVTDSLIDDFPDAPEKVGGLGVGEVVVPVWSTEVNREDAVQRYPRQREILEAMLMRGVTLTFSLNGIPKELAQLQVMEQDQLLDLFNRETNIWKPYLAELLMNFGLEVSQWQIGVAGGMNATSGLDPVEALRGATAALGQFIPQMRPALPFAAIEDARDFSPYCTRHFQVSHEISPEALADYGAIWREDGEAYAITLESLPENKFTPRQRVTDLALRGLHAWRAGAPVIRIESPWGKRRDGSSPRQPTPAFPLWRTLAAHLNGRKVLGEMSVAEGVECWILASKAGENAGLVVWDRRISSSSPAYLQALLAPGTVTVVDLAGNEQVVAVENGRHRIPLGSAPVFVEGINPNLCLFHGGLAIQPEFVPAVSKRHEREIVLQNPWDVAIGGTLRIVDDSGLDISPRVMSFSIRSGGEVRLPVALQTSRSMTAGMKRIETEIELSADHEYFLRLHDELEVGLRFLKCTPVWRTMVNPRTGRTDLIVGLTIINRGAQPVNLDAYLFAPGFPRLHKLIGGLRPGDTAMRSFRLEDGARLMSGEQIGLGVLERDGSARLNFSLDIPELGGDSAMAVEEGKR